MTDEVRIDVSDGEGTDSSDEEGTFALVVEGTDASVVEVTDSSDGEDLLKIDVSRRGLVGHSITCYCTNFSGIFICEDNFLRGQFL